MNIKDILNRAIARKISVDEAAELLSEQSVADMGFAKIDTDRHSRRGLPEVIYCPGKTAGQIVDIMQMLRKHRQDVLATRASPEQYDVVRKAIPDSVYHAQARIITLDSGGRRPTPVGMVAILCAGTSDIPVAEEAAVTCERMGARTKRLYDVGVAGLHRLVRHVDVLKSATVVVVVAGMEGALPSVVGGLIDKPVIAVPSSVGYGTGLKGVAALLAMLNTCVPGITVVNIDNGFGAGVAAAMINSLGRRSHARKRARGRNQERTRRQH